MRVTKRHIDDSDDEIERRAADRRPSHSGEKKKKYNEDHLRYFELVLASHMTKSSGVSELESSQSTQRVC
jgi:hypothetical protein